MDNLLWMFFLSGISFLLGMVVMNYIEEKEEEKQKPETLCKNCQYCEVKYIDKYGIAKIKTSENCPYGSCYDPPITISCDKFIRKNKE